MITINGVAFYEMPCMCGACPFFLAGKDDNRGWCTAFEKHKGRYANLPKRCKDIFEKGFETGGDLVIVMKN